MTTKRREGLDGHRDTRLGRSPFGPAAPSIAAALAYAAAAIAWIIAGDVLPGDRWLAMHLFTLGVVTNLVLVFSEHFGRTLTRTPVQPIRWQVVAANAGILPILIGLPMGADWAVAVGATIITAVVAVSYWRLRRMRRQAIGARFGWIVRIYERAHGAFVHGAILGLLLGIGVLSGSWYLPGRVAHLHVNIAGWAGLTLLATLVFFGPTIARTRIVQGADARAAVALRHGATGLTVAVLLLLATGVGGVAATALRLAAAAAMAVYAVAVTVVSVPVATAAHRANPSAARWPIVAVGGWFPLVAWADVVVIALGDWRWLDVVGLAMVLGVLAQTIAAVLTYLAPMLRARSFGGRDRLLARLETGATIRTLAFNLGVLAVVAGAVLRGAAGAVLARGGWGLVVGSLAWLAVTAASPAPRNGSDDEVASQVARRYRP
jgi:nitrite reductase (NO-forming)